MWAHAATAPTDREGARRSPRPLLAAARLATDQKKLTRLGARLLCLDETGFLMAPVLRRTWALRGVPPRLPIRTRSHEKVSGLGVLSVSPRRRRFTLYLALYPRENVRGPQILQVLRHLNHLRGPVVVLWDRARPHRHGQVRQWLAARAHWHVECFPPYAPDLNPVDHLWAYLKYGRLPNFTPNHVTDIHRAPRQEVRHLKRRPRLLQSFFRHAKLLF
ncbi:MAG: transposase [Armatimonadota bacterium]|nr:transposase [Armatimonadota bacterium]